LRLIGLADQARRANQEDVVQAIIVLVFGWVVFTCAEVGKPEKALQRPHQP